MIDEQNPVSVRAMSNSSSPRTFTAPVAIRRKLTVTPGFLQVGTKNHPSGDASTKAKRASLEARARAFR